MLAMLPRHLPALSALLADLGEPSASEVGSALDVDARTVRRWIAVDHAPRPAMLALFWLTRRGRSEVECAAVNDARMAAQLAGAHERAALAHAASVEHLLSVGDFGAANAPLLDVG